jgi:hypothetical protein
MSEAPSGWIKRFELPGHAPKGNEAELEGGTPLLVLTAPLDVADELLSVDRSSSFTVVCFPNFRSRASERCHLRTFLIVQSI